MTSKTRTTAFVVALALAAALFVGSFVGATQYAASRLSSRWRLGPPAVVIAQTPVYVPWAWLGWSQRLEAVAPEIFALAQAINFGGALASFAVLMAAVAGIRGSAVSTTHGSAHWAATKDLRRAGLLDPGGVVLCQTADARYSAKPDGKSGTRWAMKRGGRLIRHDGPEHVFVFAPTRSGKGIGIVIPTLLTWSRSVLVYW